MRRAGIRFLSGLIRLFSGLQIKDCTSGYRAVNKTLTEAFSKHYPLDYPEPESLVEIAKSGFRCIEVPVRMFERSGGTSSIRAWRSVYYMIKVSLAIAIAGTGTRKGVR